MSCTDPLPVVFTAQSKLNFYCRDAVCEFVFKQKAIPLNPFRVFEYFLHDRVDRDMVRQGNNNLIRLSDELWVFGETIADGVLFEIQYARKLGKPIRFFTIDNRAERIREISVAKLTFERELYSSTGLKREELLAKVTGQDPFSGDNLSQLPLFLVAGDGES